MRTIACIIGLIITELLCGFQMIRAQSVVTNDWLLNRQTYPAAIKVDTVHKEILLSNTLLSRLFRIYPNVACVDYENVSTDEQLVRAVMPEARLVLNGRTYAVGGLYGQLQRAYLREAWIDSLKAHSDDFQFDGFETRAISPFLHWVSHTWTGNGHLPSGKELILRFHCPDTALKGLIVTVHYALYDNIPLLCKWVTLYNGGVNTVKVDGVVNEILAMPEEQSAVVGTTGQMIKPHGLYIESDYAFNNAMRYDLSDQTTHWKADSSYTSQVNYNFQTPCLLEAYPPIGPGVILGHGDSLRSIRTFELLMDGYDRERRGLAVRRMYRTIAPWVTQNPIFMHLVSQNDAEVYTAIDQCAATGYEAVILSFGSHCRLEDTSAPNIRSWARLADYAHSKGILIGGYSLFSSRHISDSDDVISPRTGKPGEAFFGYAPCYGSRWGLAYLSNIEYFLQHTGFDIFENDGPYAGDLCASTHHPGHRGVEDSQWEQMLLQKSLYHWCNEKGIYVNAPDWYFLDGTNKIALGYREVNFSLPRDQQLILNRQNIYDGTWEKTPSMGWGFVPLTRYQGGGPEAVLEPLDQHRKDYEQLMIQYYGAGIQACYRGPRLYDTDSTKLLVSMVIQWYKRYRNVLNGDIIHLRRPDGRDWDGIMHVDPEGTIKGFVLLYNPLDVAITRSVALPLYYLGISDGTPVHVGKGRSVGNGGSVAPTRAYFADKDDRIHVTVDIPPKGYCWYTIE